MIMISYNRLGHCGEYSQLVASWIISQSVQKNLVEKPYRVIASGTMLSVIQVHPRDIIDRPGTKYEP